MTISKLIHDTSIAAVVHLLAGRVVSTSSSQQCTHDITYHFFTFTRFGFDSTFASPSPLAAAAAAADTTVVLSAPSFIAVAAAAADGALALPAALASPVLITTPF